MAPRWLGLVVVGAASCATTSSDLPASHGLGSDAAGLIAGMDAAIAKAVIAATGL